MNRTSRTTQAYELRSIGRQGAISLAESRWWVECSSRDAFLFQSSIEELCMPLDELYRVAAEALGRPVYTHEFRDFAALRSELFGETPHATFEDVVAKIPTAMRVVVFAP